MTFPRPSRKGLAFCLAITVALPFLVGQGCPIPTGTSGAGASSLAVTAPSLSKSIFAGEKVIVVYSTAAGATVSAFYDRDGTANTGDEVVFASGLPSGDNRFAQWNTTGLAAGDYRLGITAGSSTAYAFGVITVQQSLTVTVATPADDVMINPGGQVNIRFAATIASGYNYTVFYDSDSSVDHDETAITAGSATGSDVQSVTWDTSIVPTGTYFIGVTVTEVGGSARKGVAYAGGRVTLIAGRFLSVISPAVDLTVAPGVPVSVTVASGDPESITPTVDIFYDTDQTFSGLEPTIETGLSLGQTSVLWDTFIVPSGSYYIGAVLRLTPSAPPTLTAYSAGRITVEGTLETNTNVLVLTPSVDQTVFQGDMYTIRWSTGATLTQGTFTVLRDPDVNNDGKPDGVPVVIADGLNPALRSYVWDTTDILGRFFIIGRLVMPDGNVEDASAGRLTIRSPFFWVGDIDKNLTPGAVLRGFNFQDHAGSGFTSINDVDGDGVDDFIVLAPFGKPGLVNPNGVGNGEAYLIYGNRQRLSGIHDLNRTGNKPAQPGPPTSTDGIDQGVLFTGVTIPAGSNLTTGITSVISAPDMDGDGRDELVFAIPKADSLSLSLQLGSLNYEGILENSGQFLRGGIIIVSSTNTPIATRTAVSRDGNRVIRLQEVGQVFQTSQCNPSCQANIPCIDQPCLGQAFKDDAANPVAGCDSFDYNVWRKFFYQPPFVDPPLADIQSLCPLDRLFLLDPPAPPVFPAITGMFTGVGDLEPIGARILGQALEDGTQPDSRFGLGVAAIRTNSGPNFLLISAPNQTVRQFDVPELPSDRVDSGVVYQLMTSNFWDVSDTLPTDVSRPHQYIIRTAGYFTGIVPTVGRALDVITRPRAIVGPAANTRISNVTSIPDFNGDGLVDFVVGSPNEGASSNGAVYIVFRRLLEAEGNYLLEKLALDPTDPERLNGVLIRGEANNELGHVFTGGGDFNGDGTPDVIIGIPNYQNGMGAALIVFGRQDLISPLGGFEIDDMVANGDAALIVGNLPGDQTGFNVASVGDFDGDAKDDILISAPGASPMFKDSNGVLQIGLDINGDGTADDLDNNGVPDNLTGAGIVYLVMGSNALLGTIDLSQIGTSNLKGFAFVGRTQNDSLGGGQSSLGLGVRSRGVSGAGDVDGDGLDDILIGSMLADPKGKTNGGECYLIYGGFRP